MATIKKAQMGKKVVSPSYKKKITDQQRDEMGFPVSPSQKKSTEKALTKSVDYKGRPKMKKGGSVKKAKSGASLAKLANMKKGGKSFPDLNKDGKITKADILKGRGVIAKKGAKMSKCKYGCK